MNDQDIVNELTYGKHPLHEWDTGELEVKVEEFKSALRSSPFKIVVGLCIYNEAQFIRETLENLKKIKDIDAIHILDGAWAGGGDSVTSKDDTHKIIVEWIMDNNFNVTYERSKTGIFKSEGDKRNYQLRRIFEEHGHCYVLVHDGDEEIRFNCGKEQVFLKQMCADMWPRTIIMESYAYNGVNGHIGVRMIPTGLDIHYHTGKPMVVHDFECNIICDYNFDKTSFIRQHDTLDFDMMYFVNKWNIRNRKRAFEKDSYVEEVFTNGSIKKCEYKPL